MDRLELARRLGWDGRVAEARREATVVEALEPELFQRAFAEAAGAGGPVFLADPAWGPSERSELQRQLALPSRGDGRGWLMIPSGGTSGRLKFARHDESTIAAAVRGFCAHVGASRVNCVGVLPLHHVSGLMAWMRAVLTGGNYLAWEWKRLEAGDRPSLAGEAGRWFLSLVPTQLQRLLSSGETCAWLRNFEAVFLGGGPHWPELADAAAAAKLPLSPSYGMTETAAMVAALPPREFLAGDRSSGIALPHASLAVTSEGLLSVTGESVFRGYYPEFSDGSTHVTEDLARIDDLGRLHLMGRRDAVIITGGKKVDPAELEALLRATGEFADVAVLGVPDPEWGQRVVACYPSGDRAPDLKRVAEALSTTAPFKRPRRYVALADWPRNAQGKLNRASLVSALEADSR